RLISVTLNAKLQILGRYTFQSCNNLESINLGEATNLTTIKVKAFEDVDHVRQFTIPNSVTTIEESAFHAIDSLRTVIFASGSKLTTLGNDVFRDNTKMESINIEACTQLTNFPNSWLYNCPSVKTLTVPASVETFGNSMFYYTDNIETITFLAPTIPNDFYNGRSNLKTVNIGSGVKSIGNYAFRNSYGLTRLNIDSGVNDLVIGNSAFQNADALETLTLPKGIISIGADAFSYIDSLRTISFATGSKLTTLGNNVFRDNTKLERINIEACTSLTIFPNYWLSNCPSVKSLTVPASVETFGSSMFSYTDNIETITFLAPTVPNDFYNGRSNLKTVNIGSGVKSIGNYAFRNSYGLTRLNIDSGVNDLVIGNSAFQNADALETLTLPKGIVSIGASAFSYIDSLRTISFATGIKLTTLGNDVFRDNTKLERINIEACTSLTNFPSYWLNNCPGITSLIVPASVETFGSNNMFSSTNNIETITFLAPTVPNDFYNGRSNLKTVNIGSGVKSIGNYAFRSSYGLTRLSIDSGVNDLVIGNYAFQNADALETLTLPKGIISIGASAFQSIDSLRIISFATGSKLTTLGNDVFRDNTKLERINIEACTQLT
ncbi:MAG: leucine-rich repeat domain-containing protein, partial [Prevotella sp.]|nr:leucine-rich repeat domain-containing protein [Prevotella sp.]